jgi:hypothetical protein
MQAVARWEARFDAELLLMMIALSLHSLITSRTLRIQGNCARQNEDWLERFRSALMWHLNLGPHSTLSKANDECHAPPNYRQKAPDLHTRSRRCRNVSLPAGILILIMGR